MALDIVSPEELYRILSDAASQDPRLVQSSSQRLKMLMETKFGTYEGLFVMATTPSLPLLVRQQSIIQFKNAIAPTSSTGWRSRKYLNDEQRTNIRARSLGLLQEDNDIIWKANKAIVAKISRVDFPKNWPSLIDTLIVSIDTSLHSMMSMNNDPHSSLVFRRSIDALNQILKEFASIKMPSGIQTMKQLSETLIPVLQGYYEQLTSNYALFLTPSAIAIPRTAEAIYCAHIVFKCLMKISVWLWNKHGRPGFEQAGLWPTEFFNISAKQFSELYELRKRLILEVRGLEGLTDTVSVKSLQYLSVRVRAFGKFFRRMQQTSAERFVRLPKCNELVMYYWNTVVQAIAGPREFIADVLAAPIPVQFLVQAMAIFKDSMSQWSRAMNDTELSIGFVQNAVEFLVYRFIPLNPKDLDSWSTDPEEWLNSEDKDEEQWEFELRPCSERVLMTLANRQSSIVTPLLVAALSRVNVAPAVTLEAIVEKEAVYCAVGRCAAQLQGTIPMDQWLERNLIMEALDTNPYYPIIKRRIAWLIGKWVPLDITARLTENPRLWELLVHLLRDRGAGSDTVVRLTALMAIKSCVNVVNFTPDAITPYLETIIIEFVRLTGEAEELETKRRILESFNILIENVGIHIVPYINVINRMVPQLWSVVERSKPEDWLFKACLLETVTKSVEASREHAVYLGDIVVPLVSESFSPESKLHLDETGLVLWLAALRNASTLDSSDEKPSLYSLFPVLLDLLGTNADLLGKILSITESYLLIDAPKLLQGYGLYLCRAFMITLGQPLVMNIKDTILCISLMVQLSASRLWAEPMHHTGLFAAMLDTIMEDKASVPTLTELILAMARIALVDSGAFLNLIAATASERGVSEAVLWEGLLNQWWRRFDNMSEPQHRKLVAMGIASLVATGRPEVLDRLSSEIFNLWIDVFGEMREAYAEATEDASRSSPNQFSFLIKFWQGTPEPPSAFMKDTEGTLEGNRRQNIYATDPVSTVKLTAFIANCYRSGQQICGGQQVLQTNYLQDVDPTVLKQILDELNSTP